MGCKWCNRETKIQPPQCNSFWTSLLNLWYSTVSYFTSNCLLAQANAQMNYNKLLWSGWSRWLLASSWQCSTSRSHGQWYASEIFFSTSCPVSCVTCVTGMTGMTGMTGAILGPNWVCKMCSNCASTAIRAWDHSQHLSSLLHPFTVQLYIHVSII